MRISARFSALVLSAGALSGAALIGPVHAASWSLFPSLTGQSNPPAPVVAAPAEDANPPLQLVGNGGHYGDGSYTGSITDAYYGPLQVQANVRDGRLVSIDVLQYPADRRASQRINSSALPRLESEVISAQSTRVNIVSGATLTSNAYLRSLNAALARASS